jgi:hypothetical protein
VANKSDNGNLRGTVLEVPKGPGSFIGKRFRTFVTAAVNCVFNWKFLVRYYDSDGNYIGTKEAETVMGPRGAVTTFPPMGGAATAGGSGTGAVTGFNFRGVWVPIAYYINDAVCFGTGTSSGMWLSLIDNNTNAPDTGIGWWQISSSSGTWM